INLPFLLYQIFTIFTENPISLIFPAIGIPFMISLSYLLYIIKAFGGADAKALMCLAIVFPFYPEISPFLFNRGIGIFSFSVLTNSVIFAPFLMLAMLLRNLIREGFGEFSKNIFYYFTGYKIPVDKIRFHNLFEFIDKEGRLKRVKRAVEWNEEKIRLLKKAGIEEVWVTPALPFMVFITFGYFVAIFFGDIIVEIMIRFV
ncbi:MAG: A24 family peptidase C-terminal domain-containing protein, partial [Archaeoglobaceae archaeon]